MYVRKIWLSRYILDKSSKYNPAEHFSPTAEHPSFGSHESAWLLMPPRITSNLLFNRVPFRYSERFVIPVPRCRRSLSLASSLTELCTKPSSTYQIYISKTYDPFLNLSIEHFLLQKTPTDSTILFLYVNDPCVVIGRNQNPWLEANLRLLAKHLAPSSPSILTGKDEQKHLQPIQLVRRRSGGGTVFHDHGNINYSVICPTSDFTRDKHAEMVVRAIRHDNPRARVNERHDIVLDQGCVLPLELQPDPADMHATAYSTGSGEHPPLKVSGSAYKLTRNRSLHHGTCLLSSPNLAFISQCLRSPAKPFMKARGVESVRSPISNVYPAKQTDYGMRFQRNVLESFAELYGLDRDCISSFRQDEMDTHLQHGDNWVSGYLTADLANVREIQCGLKELRVRVPNSRWILVSDLLTNLHSHPNGYTVKPHSSLCPPILRRKTIGVVQQ